MATTSPVSPTQRRRAPLPPRLSPDPSFKGYRAGSAPTSLKELLSDRQKHSPIPPPSPALSFMSSDDGFSTFDSPATLHSSTFHFQQHFDENLDADSPAFDEDDSTEVMPAFIAETQLPPSPKSLTSGGAPSDHEFSPSPSLASVRTAKITQVPLSRGTSGGVRTLADIAASRRQSFETAESGDEEAAVVGRSLESHETVFDVTAMENRLGERPQTPLRPVLVTRVSVDEVEKKAAAAAKEKSKAKEVDVPVNNNNDDASSPAPASPVKAVPVPTLHRRATSDGSQGSSSSWKAELDKAVVSLGGAEADPRLRPEVDAMSRMNSILGPKLKINSPAPWDAEEADTASVHSTIAPVQTTQGRRSVDANRRLHYATSSSALSEKTTTKENVKPKSSSRTRSFSVLSSRRATVADPDGKASEEALRGLGLGLGLGFLPTAGDSPTKSRSMKNLKITPPVPAMPFARVGDSFLDMDETKTFSSGTFSNRKVATPPLGGGTFSFPPRPSPSTPVSSTSSGRSAKSKGRAPTPVFFEMIPTSTSSSSAPRSPSSAPSAITTFVAKEASLERSGSGSSLTVKVPPPLSTSNSARSLTSTISPPGGLPSPTSPLRSAGLGLGLGLGVDGTTSPGGGYKLISLEEARQREAERQAAAAAQRKAMLPVEHIAGREEVSYGATGATSTTREPKPSSSSGATSKHVSTASGPPAAAVPPSAPAPVKALKSRKSGFLKRMMGGDKTVPEMPSHDSFRSLSADDYASSSGPSVFVSSPSDAPGLSLPASISTGKVSFLATPTPDPSQRLGTKGLAPSLSLRPVSMAFSAGLTDFLAENSPPKTTVELPAVERVGERAPRQHSPPVESAGGGGGGVTSPLAPSFASTATVTTNSTLFDDSASTTTTSTTAMPLSPGYSPLIPYFHQAAKFDQLPAIAFEGPESFAVLQEHFAKARKVWKSQQGELEAQLRALKKEVEELRGEKAQADEGEEEDGGCEGQCDHCGCPVKEPKRPKQPAEPVTVLSRPRPVQRDANGSLFGSGPVPTVETPSVRPHKISL